ncbi:NAD(P)-binding Rossmann-fold superfamily protein [Striga asiatica]|uniref:NAD(P)-binding Rossmann-fold superfamily protein n=1 Tax=Striga asiatica TaxID=4170 RepID=A0A5A7QWF1_STRAF|nr:NAD(P)-binding Rossmann-fold superfamily protein [Striga asiatica]
MGTLPFIDLGLSGIDRSPTSPLRLHKCRDRPQLPGPTSQRGRYLLCRARTSTRRVNQLRPLRHQSPRHRAAHSTDEYETEINTFAPTTKRADLDSFSPVVSTCRGGMSVSAPIRREYKSGRKM